MFALSSFIKLIVSGESFGLLVPTLDLCFGEQAEKLSMPPQERLRLDKEACLFPEAHHPDQEHHKKPSCLLEGRSFDLSAQHETLLS